MWPSLREFVWRWLRPYVPLDFSPPLTGGTTTVNALSGGTTTVNALSGGTTTVNALTGGDTHGD